MNTRDLEYIVAVSETAHFGKAAERCNVSQPALSGQIKKLEDRLGIVLFERTNRTVHVTDLGVDFVQRARAILAQVEELEAAARAFSDPFSGTVRIGMIHTIGPYLAPLFLREVRRILPGLELHLVEDMTGNLEAALLEGALDAAVLATRPTDPKLTETELYDEPFWIAMPGRHPLANRDAVGLMDLEPRELLLLADGHCLRDQVSEAVGLDRFSDSGPGAPSTQRTSLTTLLSLVGAGLGVTLVPAMSLGGSWTTDSGVIVRPEASGTAGRTVGLVSRRSFPRRAVADPGLRPPHESRRLARAGAQPARAQTAHRRACRGAAKLQLTDTRFERPASLGTRHREC